MPAVTEERRTEAAKSLDESGKLANRIVTLLDEHKLATEPCLPVALLMLSATSLARAGTPPLEAVRIFSEFLQRGRTIESEINQQTVVNAIIESLFKNPGDYADDLKNARH